MDAQLSEQGPTVVWHTRDWSRMLIEFRRQYVTYLREQHLDGDHRIAFRIGGNTDHEWTDAGRADFDTAAEAPTTIVVEMMRKRLDKTIYEYRRARPIPGHATP
ncbi:hypothetical protein AYO40_03190 [Planctomycetaceae bacterium SCGC AG-212-D15]|nr:hypothetical protein AYO40_03190 [Planctomycetaceae bacterium SCGC AG-212-D15]